ncbi:hypothetical protein BGZ72_001530 [Mortierella alpina]|nr:hypothetical protein BGZ72_001530 [Mortierella alpina]
MLDAYAAAAQARAKKPVNISRFENATIVFFDQTETFRELSITSNEPFVRQSQEFQRLNDLRFRLAMETRAARPGPVPFYGAKRSKRNQFRPIFGTKESILSGKKEVDVSKALQHVGPAPKKGPTTKKRKRAHRAAIKKRQKIYKKAKKGDEDRERRALQASTRQDYCIPFDPTHRQDVASLISPDSVENASSASNSSTPRPLSSSKKDDLDDILESDGFYFSIATLLCQGNLGSNSQYQRQLDAAPRTIRTRRTAAGTPRGRSKFLTQRGHSIVNILYSTPATQPIIAKVMGGSSKTAAEKTVVETKGLLIKRLFYDTDSDKRLDGYHKKVSLQRDTARTTYVAPSRPKALTSAFQFDTDELDLEDDGKEEEEDDDEEEDDVDEEEDDANVEEGASSGAAMESHAECSRNSSAGAKRPHLSVSAGTINWKRGSKLLTSIETVFARPENCPDASETTIIGIGPGEIKTACATRTGPVNDTISRRYLRKQWDMRKAQEASYDYAIKPIMGLGGASDCTKRDESRPNVNFAVGLGSFNSQTGLQSKHEALIRKLVIRVRSLKHGVYGVHEYFTSARCPRRSCNSFLQPVPKSRSRYCRSCEACFDRDHVGSENIGILCQTQILQQQRPDKFKLTN